MTRQEYRSTAKEVFHWADNISYMPSLLRLIACELFVKGDMDSALAVETRRRLIQLETENGVTDP